MAFPGRQPPRRLRQGPPVTAPTPRPKGFYRPDDAGLSDAIGEVANTVLAGALMAGYTAWEALRPPAGEWLHERTGP